MKRNIWKMSLILILGFFVVLAAPHNITLLEVPQYGSPHTGARLACHYVSHQGDPELHSVKWYQDENEIFRYTPGSQPPTRMFNSTVSPVSKGICNQQICSIHVQLNDHWNTRIKFTCEVSTEGPRFAVAKQTKYLNVAVPLREDPVVTGIPRSAVQPGEELLLNCSTTPSMPPAEIMWYIDGRAETSEPWLAHSTTYSPPDADGLSSSWRLLSFRAPPASAVVRCETLQSSRPPAVRHSDYLLTVARSPNLSMFTAYGSGSAQRINGFVVLPSVLLYLLFKYCALNDVGLTK